MKIKDEKFKVEDLNKYIEESIGSKTIIAVARSIRLRFGINPKNARCL